MKILDNELQFYSADYLLIIIPSNTVLLACAHFKHCGFTRILLLDVRRGRSILRIRRYCDHNAYAYRLNVASTRLILANGGDAGKIIKRSAIARRQPDSRFCHIYYNRSCSVRRYHKGWKELEVAARFTLDAMPGKQMAIDADLNSGLISEETAKERRQKIQRKQTLRCMDGATKFVKGDAILAIIMVFVNCSAEL